MGHEGAQGVVALPAVSIGGDREDLFARGRNCRGNTSKAAGERQRGGGGGGCSRSLCFAAGSSSRGSSGSGETDIKAGEDGDFLFLLRRVEVAGHQHCLFAARRLPCAGVDVNNIRQIRSHRRRIVVILIGLPILIIIIRIIIVFRVQPVSAAPQRAAALVFLDRASKGALLRVRLNAGGLHLAAAFERVEHLALRQDAVLLAAELLAAFLVGEAGAGELNDLLVVLVAVDGVGLRGAHFVVQLVVAGANDFAVGARGNGGRRLVVAVLGQPPAVAKLHVHLLRLPVAAVRQL